MHDTQLRNVTQEKDIGVSVETKIWGLYIWENKKANNMMGIIRRSFIHLYEEIFLKLIKQDLI